MRKVLVLGYVWPEPRSSAAGSRMLELLGVFRSQGWQVTFASAAALSTHRADLAELAIEEVAVALNCDSTRKIVRRSDRRHPRYAEAAVESPRRSADSRCCCRGVSCSEGRSRRERGRRCV